MTSMSRGLIFTLLLATSGTTVAEQSFMISPSFGKASVSDVDNYENSTHLRFDGTYYIIPEFGLNLFVTDYAAFETSLDYGSEASIDLDGYGIGFVGRWPAHSHIQPYLRAEYFAWDAELTAFGHTIGKDSDYSTGIALGLQLPIASVFGLKLEGERYYDVSGADIDQLTFGLTFEF